MAFSTGNDSGGPMSEINVTPLVDVMLVLLIIFMITAPLMSQDQGRGCRRRTWTRRTTPCRPRRR